MKSFLKIYWMAIWFLLVSCEPEFDAVPTPQSGQADFGRYIAIGNSLTAGYSDNGLYEEAQRQSYPAQLAKQMSLVGGGDFNQPIAPGDGSGHLSIERFDDSGNPIIGLVPPDPGFLNPIPGDYNNLGIPGIKVVDILTPGYGINPEMGNPFFFRILGDGESLKTYVEKVQESQPTFFTCWLGNNDVLAFAASGGLAPLSDPGDFTNAYQALMNVLEATGASGVLGTIPSITLTPFFSTVPWNAIGFDPNDATDVATVELLTQSYAGLNAALAGLAANGLISAPEAEQRKISFTLGLNAVVIEDTDLNDLGEEFDLLLAAQQITAGQRAALQPYVQARQAVADELITLPASTLLGTLADPSNPLTVIGVAVPLEDQFALTIVELAEISQATEAFNNTIRSYASSSIAILDPNVPLVQAATGAGILVDGISISDDFISGGAFSLDGIHLTPRGYSLVTNEMIRVINEKFGATLPPVNSVQFRGVILP